MSISSFDIGRLVFKRKKLSLLNGNFFILISLFTLF